MNLIKCFTNVDLNSFSHTVRLQERTAEYKLICTLT